MSITERCQCLPCALHPAQAIQWAALVLGEAHGGANLETLAHALLFVRIDFVAAPGGDVLQAEELAEREAEGRLAAFTYIKAHAVADGVQVAALLALLCAACGHILVIFHSENDAVDDVARAFVVDDGARAKLGDRQEARA